MKLFLKLLMGLKLSVAYENSRPQNLLIDDANFENAFLANEYEIYQHWDLNRTTNFQDFVQQNWEKIVLHNLSDYKEAKTVLEKTNMKFINYEDFSLTVEFNNKQDYNLLKKPLQKSFDVYFYNYDNLQKALKKFEEKFVLPNSVINLSEMHLYDYLEENFKDYFNQLCKKYILLNNETEFFDYVNIKELWKDKLVLDFLNSSSFKLKIMSA